MALEVNITTEHHFFSGEDKKIKLVIYTSDAKTAILDTSSMSLLWQMRKKDNSADPALISKSTDVSPPGITHEGVYDSDPDVNTQKVVITLLDTDTYDDGVSPLWWIKKRKYRHALKRMDDGFETVLAFGNCQILQATTR